METTPKANRLHIGFFGCCNAGKSTLINLLTDQPVSLVSEVAGTTTDPVQKAMEILPLGAVMLTDTAGVDDTSELGALRLARTKAILPQMHIGVYVLRSDRSFTNIDRTWLSLLAEHRVPTLLVLNRVGADMRSVTEYLEAEGGTDFLSLPNVAIHGQRKEDREAFLAAVGACKPVDAEEVTLLQGMVEPGDTIVLVCPIDDAAPKGRLILPQVQMLREILDRRAQAMVVQTEELAGALAALQSPPRLVITDSQAFEAVAAIVPESIPLTSFSILMARFKGDLEYLVAGVDALDHLQPGSRVLISEGCTHRRQCDDIGTVKIPRWLAKAGHTDLDLHWTSGGAFPEDVASYNLIIHCGACMLTRREVLRRIDASVIQGVPIVNYGVLIAHLHGILPRALSPFRETKLV